MHIKYTQLYYSDETEQKMFPNQREDNVLLIVLDSANLNKGKSFDTENEKILNFLEEQKSCGCGKIYDYIITKTGAIYKLSPVNKCGTSLRFNLYSEYASKLLPNHCPQTDGSLYKPDKYPDQVAISILVECDNDENTNIDCGVLSDCTKEAIEDIIAYYISNFNIVHKNIIGRYRLPKTKEDINCSGPSFFKHDPILQILTISYAISITRNENYIELNKAFDLYFD